MEKEERYLRQLDIYDPQKKNPDLHIVGAGGIGSFAALALAKLGIERTSVYDFDKVEEHNQPNQMYGVKHIGMAKTEALQEIVLDYADATLEVKNQKIGEGNAPMFGGIVVSAVDSMASRKAVWEVVKVSPGAILFLDGRIGGEVLKLYTLNPLDEDEQERYEKTLHADDVAAPLPCTAQAVIDVGFVIAALITRSVRRYLKDGYKEFEVIHDEFNWMPIIDK